MVARVLIDVQGRWFSKSYSKHLLFLLSTWISILPYLELWRFLYIFKRSVIVIYTQRIQLAPHNFCRKKARTTMSLTQSAVDAAQSSPPETLSCHHEAHLNISIKPLWASAKTRSHHHKPAATWTMEEEERFGVGCLKEEGDDHVLFFYILKSWSILMYVGETTNINLCLFYLRLTLVRRKKSVLLVNPNFNTQIQI